MRIIAKRTLKDFWEKYPDSEEALRAWYDEAVKENWTSFHEIKEKYRTASILGNDRVVFNIKGNRYRLIVLILFGRGKIFIRIIGTHAEYDKINAKNI